MRPMIFTVLMLAFSAAALPAYGEENMQQETITRPADDTAENGSVSDMNDDAANESTATSDDSEKSPADTAEDTADNGSVSDMNADAADEPALRD